MKYKLLASLLFPAVFLTLASTAVATTWYVNGVSGSDINNNCLSSTTACKTIGHTIALAEPADTIRIAAATYTEHLTIGISLTILGSSAATTIIDGGAERKGRHNLPKYRPCDPFKAHYSQWQCHLRRRYQQLWHSDANQQHRQWELGAYPVLLILYAIFIRVCLFRGAASGGGIYNSGALIISNSIISGNHAGSYCNANPCSAFGGGIFNQGSLMTIKNSTLTGNSAGTACSTSLSCSVGGGGAFYTSGGTVTLNNSTVYGSSADRCSAVCGGTGGAIVNGSGSLAMNNSTVSGNSAGGIFSLGTTTLQNSIVANKSVTNCVGTIKSFGYNLSSDGSCPFNNSGDRNNANPLLGTLGYYGGPTPTLNLLNGSPAIDAGNPSGCTDGLGHLLTTDQRGFARPDHEDSGGCDSGHMNVRATSLETILFTGALQPIRLKCFLRVGLASQTTAQIAGRSWHAVSRFPSAGGTDCTNAIGFRKLLKTLEHPTQWSL